MNREIKFRGKRLDSDKWAYGKGVVFLPKENLAMVIEQVKGNLSQHTGVEPKTVGQYTGLKDKNGVEIYEGDIVNYEDPVGDVYYNNQVIFNMDILLSNLEWGLDNDKGYMSLDIGRYKVVGNVHENPELL